MTSTRRWRTLRGGATIVAAISLLLAGAPPASAAQSASWGWTTDTFVMSFFGGIPYVGCEKSSLTVPNSGSTGDIGAITTSSIVVGASPTCSGSTIPSALNADTIRTRVRVTRNGAFVSGCTSSMIYNSAGQGTVTAATGSNCDKDTSADATWSVRGYYGWWDYDDNTWRGEYVSAPKIED